MPSASIKNVVGHAQQAVVRGDFAIHVQQRGVLRHEDIQQPHCSLGVFLQVHADEDDLALEGVVGLLEVRYLPAAGTAPAGVPVEDDGGTTEVGEAHDALGVAGVREGEVGGGLADLGPVVVDDAGLEADGPDQLRRRAVEGRSPFVIASRGEIPHGNGDDRHHDDPRARRTRRSAAGGCLSGSPPSVTSLRTLSCHRRPHGTKGEGQDRVSPSFQVAASSREGSTSRFSSSCTTRPRKRRQASSRKVARGRSVGRSYSPWLTRG